MRLTSLIALICCLNALADVPLSKSIPTPRGACGNALAACIDLTNDQDQSIQHLRQYASELEKRVEKDEEEPLVPTYVWIGLGIIAGGVVGYALHK